MPIEYTIIISAISVVCTVLGVSLGMSNVRRNQRTDDQKIGASTSRIEVHLEHISKGVIELKHDINFIMKEIREQRDRIIKVEASSARAHERINDLIEKKVGV